MNRNYWISVFVIMAMVLSLVGCAGTNTTSTPPEENYPTKPLEIIVPGSAGGGSDIFARTLAKVATDNKYFSQPIVVVNKPGGSGSICWGYVAEKVNDPYTISTVSSSYFTGPISGQSPVSYEDFRPIAVMGFDPSLLMVKHDSKYQSLQDIIDEAKANPEAVSCGGSSGLSDDALLFNAIVEKTGTKMNYVPFNSGGEALTAVLGGHVDFAFLSPGEAAAQIEAKAMKPLAVALDSRLEDFADVPTLIEQNVNFSLAQIRGIVGPKDMPEDTVKFLSEVFEKVSKDTEWTEGYLKQNNVHGEFMGYEEAGKRITEAHNMYLDIITKMGKAVD